jgi:hypothetical protein
VPTAAKESVTSVTIDEDVDLDALVEKLDELVKRLSDSTHAQIDVATATRQIRQLLEAEEAARK